MRKPSPALLGSVALHAGVVALSLLTLTNRKAEPPKPLVNSVPVSIVSEMVIEAAPADNPQPEPSLEDGSTSPQDLPQAPEPTPPPPEPTPPTPTPPRPTPTPPRPTPTPPRPTPTPPRPTPTPTPPKKPEPTPPRPTPTPTPPRPNPTPPHPNPTPPRTNPTPPRDSTPARPPAQRETPGLDLADLAGPQRPTGNRGRPATGQQGQGSASQATGPQVAAIFNQVYPHWNLPCDIPGATALRIQVELTLSADGRITRGPTLVNPQNSNVYRATADGALRALRQAAPFDVPSNFDGGLFRPTFNPERACANR